MRAFPHRPSAEILRASKAGVLEYLQKSEARREDALALPDPSYFWMRGEQLTLRGMLEYAEEQPPTTVVATWRSAAGEFAAALELGQPPVPWDAWTLPLHALAANLVPLAHFFASLPEKLWIGPDPQSRFWTIAQAKALSALVRLDGQESERWIGVLGELASADPPPAIVKDDPPWYGNQAAVLSAVVRNSAGDFNQSLAKRMELRTQSLLRHGSNSPLGFLDLDALGLCRLALDRGLQPTVQHPYLPLEILRIAPE